MFVKNFIFSFVYLKCHNCKEMLAFRGVDKTTATTTTKYKNKI